LIGQGHAQAAHQLMERLAASPDRLSNPMLAEVKAAVRDRRAAEFAAGGRQPAEWLSEIETWASKTLPTPARAFRKRSR